MNSRQSICERLPRYFFRACTLAQLALLASACSLSGPLRTDPKAKAYRFGSLPAEWRLTRIETGADYVYSNSASGALIAVNSTCNRYPDSSLEALTRQLTSPIQSPRTLSEEKHDLDGREALFTKVAGQLDGVATQSYFVVVRKNECIFDFTLQSLGTLRAKDEQAFLNSVREFRFDLSGAAAQTPGKSSGEES